MPFHVYRLYGITVESEFPFQELSPVAGEAPGRQRIVIRRGNVPILPFKNEPGWTSFMGLDYWMASAQQFALIRCRQAGNFRVQFAERTIEWEPKNKNSSGLARVILRGRALSLLLPYLRPAFLFHADVVVRRGEAIVLCGPPQHGKSTLTASLLMSDGFSLLSDDVAVTRPEKNGFVVEPGAPELRLWPDVAGHLKELGLKGKSLFPGIKKERFLLCAKTPWRLVEKSAPLRAVYVLSRRKRGKILIERLRGQRALMRIFETIYNPVIKDPVILKQQFDIATELALKVPVKELSYPTGFSHLPKVCQALMGDLDSSEA